MAVCLELLSVESTVDSMVVSMVELMVAGLATEMEKRTADLMVE